MKLKNKYVITNKIILNTMKISHYLYYLQII